MNRRYIYIIIIFGSLAVIYISSSVYELRQFEINGRYTIGVVGLVKNKITSSAEQDVILINYVYKNKSYHYKMNGFSYLIGQRIFVKISPSGRSIGVAADCLVPDSIRNPPSDGWDKAWMKKNFPNCYLIKEFPNGK